MEKQDLEQLKKQDLQIINNFERELEELEDVFYQWEEHEINDNMHSFERPEILDYYSINSRYDLYDLIESHEQQIKMSKQRVEQIVNQQYKEEVYV